METTAASRDWVLELIFTILDEINQTRPPDDQIEKSPETQLFGADGRLDSLGLVNLIVALEGMVADDLGVGITLADERAMSQRNSPFRSVESLAEYVVILVKGANA